MPDTHKQVATGTIPRHKSKGRTYEQWDLDRETLSQMFRVLRKDKQWNTLNKQKRDRGEYPRGGGAMLLFVPPLTRSTWRPVVQLIELAESLGFCFYGSLTWDQQILGMGYDAGRNSQRLLLFTASLALRAGFPLRRGSRRCLSTFASPRPHRMMLNPRV